jgi:hypothetical protein
MFSSFKKEERSKQVVQVLRDGDVLINKQLIKIFLISEPLSCEGATWGKDSVLVSKPLSNPSMLSPSSPTKKSHDTSTQFVLS